MLLRDLTSLRWLLENLGFIINWKKSVWAPTQEIQYLGFLIDSVNMVIRLPSEKIQIILKCQCLVSKKITTSPKDLRNFGTDDIIITGYSPGTATLSPFTNDPHLRAPGKQIISGKSGTKFRVLTGTEMVDFPDAELEWEIYDLSRARFDLDKRCLQKGVGRDPGVRTGSGFVDSRGDQPPYQCAGIERGPVCTESMST